MSNMEQIIAFIREKAEEAEKKRIDDIKKRAEQRRQQRNMKQHDLNEVRDYYMKWFKDGNDYGTYDPYADRDDYNSSSPDLDKYKKRSKVQEAKQKFEYAKQDYDYMTQIGDYDEEVVKTYEQATADYKAAVAEASPEDLYDSYPADNTSLLGSIFGRRSKSIPASKKEPIICNNIEVTKRTVRLDNFIPIMCSPTGSDTEGS